MGLEVPPIKPGCLGSIRQKSRRKGNKFATKATAIRGRSRTTFLHDSATWPADPNRSMYDSVPPCDLPPGCVEQRSDGLGVVGIG